MASEVGASRQALLSRNSEKFFDHAKEQIDNDDNFTQQKYGQLLGLYEIWQAKHRALLLSLIIVKPGVQPCIK